MKEENFKGKLASIYFNKQGEIACYIFVQISLI